MQDDPLEKALSVTTEMMTTRDIDRLFAQIVDTITSSFGFEGCDAFLLDKKTDEFRLVDTRGYEAEKSGEVLGIRTPRGNVVRDVGNSERLGRFTYLHKSGPDEDLSSYYGLMHPERASLPRENEDDWHELDVLYVTFEDQDGNLIGFLEPDSPTNGKLPSKSLVLNLEVFASLASIAVANAELVDELNQTIRNYRVLVDATAALQRPVDLNETLRMLTESLNELVSFDEIAVYLVDWERRILIPAFATGPYREEIMSDIGPISGLAGEVARTGKGEIVEDSWKDQRVEDIPGIEKVPNEIGQAMMCIPLMGKDGEVAGVIDIYREITDQFTQQEYDIAEPFATHTAVAMENFKLRDELKDNFESVRKAYEEMKNLDKAKDNLVNTISHELRTPLTTILGYLEMASEGLYGEVPPKLMEKFSAMLSSINRINSLVGKMLEMSRLQSKTINLDMNQVNLAMVTREVLDERKSEIHARKHHVQVLFGNELPVVMADRLRMHDVLETLIDNAIRYTREGGDVTVGADILAGKVHIWVRDTGIGISDEEKGKIFDKFFLADAGLTREDGRVGIGLFVSREIVRKHSGEMWLETKKGVGSTFHFTVPVGKAKRL
ncbi:MAG: GAF domain-containing sensor histidine kinase [Candidatus Thermoplasmatota archaeon]|nr:GAF domain-containing sensor histidine kinase [Candidatus Thermoplasmatota archaeon]